MTSSLVNQPCSLYIIHSELHSIQILHVVLMSWEIKDDFWFNVTFICRHQQLSEDVIHRVYLVGDFNGWRLSEGYSMRQCEEGYSVQVLLSEGFYHYKYLVDREYVRDEANPYVSGAIGNSVMFVHMDRPRSFQLSRPREISYTHRGYSTVDVVQSCTPSALKCLRTSVHMASSSDWCSPRPLKLVKLTTPTQWYDGQNLFSTLEGGGGLCWGGWYLDTKLDYYW